MPAVTLRLAVLVLGALAWQTVAEGRAQGWYAVLMALLVVLSAIAPGSLVPTAFLLAVVLLQLAEGGLDLRLPFTVVAVGAHHHLCALSADLPPDARIRVDALRRPLGRFLATQAGTLLVLGCAVAVHRADRSLPDAVLLGGTVLAVALLIVLAVGLRRRYRPVGGQP